MQFLSAYTESFRARNVKHLHYQEGSGHLNVFFISPALSLPEDFIGGQCLVYFTVCVATCVCYVDEYF